VDDIWRDLALYGLLSRAAWKAVERLKLGGNIHLRREQRGDPRC